MNRDCLNWSILRANLPIMFVWFTMTDDGGLKIPLSNWRLIKNCTTYHSASCCWQIDVHLARRNLANATQSDCNDHGDAAMMMMMSNSVNKMQVIKLTSAMSFTTMLIILWQNKHRVLPAALFAEEIVISEYVNSAVFREMSGMDSFRKWHRFNLLEF